MENVKHRLFSLDGDTITVRQVYDGELGLFRNDYPDFEENPRVTPTGKRWVNVFKEDCPHATGEFGDCGSCEFFNCEKQGDLIGICNNEKLRLTVLDTTVTTERKDA